MVNRKATPAQPQPANLTSNHMRASIPKLMRRVADLEAFDPETVRERSDPRIDALDKKLDAAIAETFGMGTQEYLRFAPHSLDIAGYNMVHTIPMHEVIAGLQVSKARELANLRTIIELFHESLEHADEAPVTKARRAFGDLDLHPEIERASGQLFRDGHYANAVEDACKVLDMLVKMRSLRMDPSGTELMQLVFSPKSPILKYNDQQSDSERSQQQGMMYLFAGAMLAIRNPRAHGIVQDHPERAIEYLSFLSMLAKSLENTSRA
jgi:uncharacterized protein (TIGR02391 family)